MNAYILEDNEPIPPPVIYRQPTPVIVPFKPTTRGYRATRRAKAARGYRLKAVAVTVLLWATGHGFIMWLNYKGYIAKLAELIRMYMAEVG